ncbi:DEAD/DEAH box helicase [Devosia sp. J2-20]|uniref:DEAD/DEAH box helicase n=1 Tax=Devosia sp. J2-20 TaxID=3026161 RepID=UPI00249CEF43|nr:DEAD/DEAH box helicase [Devosia sp. J2-20]WDR00857.1 DEAD/DEAH box helicase [Devosia sp. J2-20]
MTEAELQQWLYGQGVRDELHHIAQSLTALEIDNLNSNEVLSGNPAPDWDRLLLAGTILARSSQRLHREAALRIATAAVTLDASPPVRDAASVLFEKLANHRSATLAVERGKVAPDLDARLGIGLRIEKQRHRLENSIILQASGERLDVNNFQRDFWAGAATENSWLSASAPTASGKTFLVLEWLIDRLQTTGDRVAVYLAPTRALVSEIEAALLAHVAATKQEIEVTSLPSTEKYVAAATGDGKCIFVFTQERLHLLANLLSDKFNVDVLIVDEAHKIGDNQRGVILQDAIERTSRSSPELRVLFISPATQNPGELLDDAPIDATRVAVDSDTATVLQNIIVARQVPRKPKEWELRLREGEDYLPLGTLKLSSKPDGLRKRLAFIAAAAGESGGTLVYSNGAAEAEEVALLISQLMPQVAQVDDELAALADLARKCVHKNYALAPLVERGVAFHYGNIPSLIRMEIERLFRSGKLKFLICTSTLIEGVNLSCRTIVVRGPTKGSGNPMEAHDFWNLAGRAGRWGNEFQGNIICIDADNTVAWPNGVPKRTRYRIRRETDRALAESDSLIQYISDRHSVDAVDLSQASKFEQVSAYLLTTFTRLGSVASAPFAKRHPAAEISRMDAVLSAVLAGIEIPQETAIRNPGVSILGMQRLLSYFESLGGNPEDLVPAPPESDDAYERFAGMMDRINMHLLPVFLPHGLIPLHALIVLQWLRGFSLPTIIRKRMEYHVRHGHKFDQSTLIRNTLDLIENTARFRAPKYFSAYVDVLNQFLISIDRPDLIDEDLDIGVALELGVSSITLRSLMELGISRMGAVAIYEKIARDDLNQDGCLAWVREHQNELDGIGLPVIIVREISEKILPKIETENPGE